MPHLDSAALAADTEGLAFLAKVLDDPAPSPHDALSFASAFTSKRRVAELRAAFEVAQPNRLQPEPEPI